MNDEMKAQVKAMWGVITGSLVILLTGSVLAAATTIIDHSQRLERLEVHQETTQAILRRIDTRVEKLVEQGR